VQVTDRELRKVAPLNELLRGELGANPLFSWQWSESLRIRFRDREAGYQYQLDPRTNILIPQPVYLERTVCYPEVVDRWVFCRLMNTTQQEWIKHFHDDMLWPENGRWVPLCGDHGYVALPPFESPSYERTWSAIRMIRASRAETEQEFLDKIQNRLKSQERAADDKRRGEVEDLIPKLLAQPENSVYTFGKQSSESTGVQ